MDDTRTRRIPHREGQRRLWPVLDRCVRRWAQCLRRNGSVRPFKGVTGAWTPPKTVSGPGAPVLGILRASTGIVGAMFGLSTVGTGGRRVPRAASQGGFPGPRFQGSLPGGW